MASKIAKPTKQYSVVLEGTEKEGEGAIRRHPAAKEALISKYDEKINTVYDVFEDALKRRPKGDCLGTRQQQADKKWGQYTWETYEKVGERRTHFGSGLLNLCGVQTKEPIGIYTINRPEWVITDLACHAYNFFVVSLYDTLGKDAVEYVINHAEIKVAVVAGKQFSTFLSCVENCKSLKYVINLDPLTEEQKQLAASKEIKILSFEEVEEDGKKNPKPHTPSTPDDLVTIMYTSGTTGNPKGVMLSHRNALTVMTGLRNHMSLLGGIQENDRHLSYLPLAHSFERTTLYAVLSYGCAYGFFHGVIPELFDDIATLKPAFLVGAPRVWTRLHDKVSKNINSAGWLKKTLFDFGFNWKKGKANQPSLMDKVVFAKTKAALGGNVRWILSGSAPMDPQLGEWIQIVFCCQVIEGYGLTENFAGACISPLGEDTGFGHVGAPLTGIEVKLVDVTEMNYSSKNSPPTGEICLRGPSLFSGYYKDEKNTKEAIDSENWFHTGDIGRWNANGTLSIIDRKKNIFKLAQGEYVAVEYLEQVYTRAQFTQQIWVYGSSFQRYLVAVVVPDFDLLIPALKTAGINETDQSAICKNPKAVAMVLSDLAETAKKAKLHGFEYIKGVILTHELFTVDNGLTTPTFKLKRPQLQQKFQSEIDEIYKELSKNTDDK